MSDTAAVNETETTDASLILTFAEARVLGCLLEKEVTTPDYYPLTFNSLHTACNQSSNRDPVTDLGTDEVEEAMEGLRYKKLGMLFHQAGARVPKCKHTLENKFPYLTKGQTALLCVLLLRGQQTTGELRQRTERMHAFVDVDKVQSDLEAMMETKPQPLVRLIPAGGGRRVATYVHLLCGEPDLTQEPRAAASSAESSSTPASTWRTEMEEEISGLKEQVESLSQEVQSLRSELSQLKESLGV